MSVLPKNWVNTTLSEVADWGAGGTPSRTHNEYFGGNINWIKTGELGQGIIKDTEEKITELGLYNSSAKIFPKGSVAIAMYGATIGKTGILGIDAATNQACAVGTPIEGVIITEYLFYYLSSQKDAFIQVGQGAAQPNISQGVIKKWPIPLAPLKEQRRIIDKLNGLLARVDTCRARLDRIPLLLKRFRQAVLSAAISGQLTEDWRWEADTSNWKFERAEDVCEKVQSGGTPKEGFVDSPGIPFLKVYNIVDQKVDFHYKPQFVTADVHNGSLAKSHTKPGDVLMNIVGPPLGKVAIVPKDFPSWNINQAITLFRPSEKISTEWLYYFLCSGFSVAEIAHQTRGSAGQSNISLSQCRNFIFPVPPSEEQDEIVRRIKTLFTYADRLELHYQTACIQIEQLTPNLLDKAFRGELVQQDPTDESALTLIKHIQSTRDAQPIKPKRKLKDKKPRMIKMTKESVKKVIQQLPKEKFSFDDLRKSLSSDYDLLKDIVFGLLDEVEPSIEQVFDQDIKAMCFIRRLK